MALRVVFASETGNAEEAAFSLRDCLVDWRLPCEVASVGDIDLEALARTKVAVFVVSTAGDGEVPASMRGLWGSLLRRSVPTSALSGLRFAVFGLGDSTYDLYNAAARKLFARLRQLGGEPLTPLGLGDDQARLGYLGSLRQWTASLGQSLSALVGSGELTPDPALRHLSPTEEYTIELLDENLEVQAVAAVQGAHVATVTANQRLTAAAWAQDVRLLSLELDPLEPLTDCYEPGDILALYFENSAEDVGQLLGLLAPRCAFAPDQPLRIKCHRPRPGRIGTITTTLRALFTSLLDIGARARRSLFALLRLVAADPEEQDKLRELASPEGTDLYFDFCVRERRSYVEVLREFRSLAVDLPLLLSALPLLAPRQYSLASSRFLRPGHCDLCVAVVTHRTPYGRTVPGLCTRYIQHLAAGAAVRYRMVLGPVRRSKLLGYSSQDLPVLLVGPGTGVASMRAFVQQRVHELNGPVTFREIFPAAAVYPPESMIAYAMDAVQEDAQRDPTKKCLLFFGCRKRSRDLLFGADLAQLQQHPRSGVAVSTALSQDHPNKVYVQHRIAEQGPRVAELLLNGGAVYVAGAARSMPKAVFRALAAALQAFGGMDAAAAEHHLKALQATGRYVVESWS